MPSCAIDSMSLMLPVSRNNFIGPPLIANRRLRRSSLLLQSANLRLADDGVGERADPLDLDRHRVAGDERTDAGRRPGRDDVPGLERHDEGDELDQLIDREDQVRGVRGLAADAVDPALDAAR